MKKLWHERPLTIVMVTHDLAEAFGLGTRVIAFERRRNEPSDAGRYGASITRDIDVWPMRVAGQIHSGRDDPAHGMPTHRDGPAPFGARP